MNKWQGQPKAEANHRTLGGRAWCHECKTYCYPVSMECDCCLESEGWVRLWRRPDGVIVDENGNIQGET